MRFAGSQFWMTGFDSPLIVMRLIDTLTPLPHTSTSEVAVTPGQLDAWGTASVLITEFTWSTPWTVMLLVIETCSVNVPGHTRTVSPVTASFTAAWTEPYAGAGSSQLVAVPCPSSSTT